MTEGVGCIDLVGAGGRVLDINRTFAVGKSRVVSVTSFLVVAPQGAVLVFPTAVLLDLGESV